MGGVHIPADLDPDDARRRSRLIDELRAAREARNLSPKNIADRLGVTAPNVYAIEGRTTWQACTISRYARAVGWRIEWLLEDITVPDDGDVMAIVIAAGDTSTPERADRVAWRALCNDLVRIRRATYSAVDMGRIIGIHENAVHHWEANPDGSSVIAAQRHARGLGGQLGWNLRPAGAQLVPPRTAA
jgi:DNA-binding XRE family transcriptional regulator